MFDSVSDFFSGRHKAFYAARAYSRFLCTEHRSTLYLDPTNNSLSEQYLKESEVASNSFLFSCLIYEALLLRYEGCDGGTKGFVGNFSDTTCSKKFSNDDLLVWEKMAIAGNTQVIRASADESSKGGSNTRCLGKQHGLVGARQLIAGSFISTKPELTVLQLVEKILRDKGWFEQVLLLPQDSKIPFASWNYDIVILGISSGKPNSIVGLRIEVDGVGIHDRKVAKDLTSEHISKERFKLQTHRVYNHEIKDLKRLENRLLAVLDGFKPCSAKIREKARLQIALWNVATWLSLEELDRISEHKYNFREFFCNIVNNSQTSRKFKEACRPIEKVIDEVRSFQREQYSNRPKPAKGGRTIRRKGKLHLLQGAFPGPAQS